MDQSDALDTPSASRNSPEHAKNLSFGLQHLVYILIIAVSLVAIFMVLNSPVGLLDSQLVYKGF